MRTDPELRFQRHVHRYAYQQMWVTRRLWSEQDRERTMLTLWYAEPAIRQHYATSNATVNPDFFAMFPTQPFSEHDFIIARSHACWAHQLDNLPPVPRIHWVPVIRNFGTQTANLARTDSTTQTDASLQPSVSTVAQGGAPYGHWPPLPWNDEPNLPGFGSIGAVAMTATERENFMLTKPHLVRDEPQWHGATFLGTGSYGAVGLWCEVDENHNVIDRMVVKDAVATSRDAWRDPKNWRDRLPTEIALHRRIEARRVEEPEAFEYIVKYRAHRLLMSKRRFRLYLDFAAGGTIAAAMEKYDQKWQDIDSENVNTEECLPEAFIWYLIKALATALLALEKGTLGNDPVDHWNPIMHLDFQTPNILLSLPSKKRKHAPDSVSSPDGSATAPPCSATAPASPHKKSKTTRTPTESPRLVPILADFSLATFDLPFAHSTLAENPTDYILPPATYNTRYAPEHAHLSPSSPVTLDAKTDIWGLGRIVWALLVQTWEFHGPVREDGSLDSMSGLPLGVSANQVENWGLDDRFDEAVLIGSRDWPAAGRYSEELRALVRRCLKWEKWDRPEAREVRKQAERWLEEHPLGAARAMRGEGLGLAEADDGGLRVGERLVVRRSGP